MAFDPTGCAGLHVLVVDDHEDTLDLIQQALIHAGAVVRPASSVGEALGFLDDVDVVVTDYSMPGATGLSLLERIQQRERPVPVIVLTGYANALFNQLANAPFARVVQKPIDPWLLCRLVADVANGPRRPPREGGG
jgi:CheY-like chemotaxis protein